MYDAGRIVSGLVIFLALVTSPMWYRLVRGAEPGPPKLELVTQAKECVAPTPYMRALHMELLNSWRDDVVRRDDRIHVGLDGVEYEKSLSKTCMSCHSNKKEFCDRCHDYAAVDPYCWDCHVEPTEAQ
jgi:hypothetical protein